LRSLDLDRDAGIPHEPRTGNPEGDQRWLGRVLEQRPLTLERGRQLGTFIRRTEAAPQHHVRGRRDRRGRVQLEERQPVDDPEQVTRPLCVQELGSYGDSPRLDEFESPH